MKYIILSVLILVLTSCNNTTSKYKYINNEKAKEFLKEGDSLKKLGLFDDAIKKQLTSYSLDSLNLVSLYNLAEIYSLNANCDSAFYFLDKVTKKDSSIAFLTNPDFYNLINDRRWKSIQNEQIEEYEYVNGAFKNINLSKQLWEIKLKDQAFYFNMKVYPEDKQKYWAIKDSINKENIAQISGIIDLYGWPKESIVGADAADAVFLVIQHAELEIQKKYFPLFEEVVQENEGRKQSLALLIDRINFFDDRKQIYGSQISYDYKTKGYYFDYNGLVDPENVNIRRAEMGLGPIEEYVKIWDIVWSYSKNEYIP